MTSRTPSLDVFVPTYQRAKKLRRCLDALSNQGSVRFRVVVSDNASSDGTREVAAERRAYPIAYSCNAVNVGIVNNFNRCRDLMESDWVMLLPDDVLLTPNILTRAMNVISARPDASLYFSYCLVAAREKQLLYGPLSVSHESLGSQDIVPLSHAAWLGECLIRCPAYTGAAIFRRDVILASMPWPEDARANGDRISYLEAARHGIALFDPCVGATTTYGADNFGATLASEEIACDYRRVSQLVLALARSEGVVLTDWWQALWPTLSQERQREVLALARQTLSPSSFELFFGAHHLAAEQNRVREKWLGRAGRVPGLGRLLKRLTFNG